MGHRMKAQYPTVRTWRDRIKGPFATHASTLLANGYSPVPIIPGTKSPAGKGWDRLRTTPYTQQEVDKLAVEKPQQGLGVMGGYGGLVPIDIDTDRQEVIDAVCSVVPQPKVAKKGQKGFVAFYRAPNGWTPTGRKFLPAPNAAPLVEVLGTGKTVIPPTMHPDIKQPYQWLTEDTLFNTRLEDLPQLTDDFMEALEAALLPWCPKREFKIRPAPVVPSEVNVERLERYARETLDRRASDLASMTSGRNIALFSTVCRVGNWVHHGYLSGAEMVDTLKSAYDRCGAMKEHGRHAFENSVKSGMRTCANDPLWVPEERDGYLEENIKPADPTALIANAAAGASNVHQMPGAIPLEREFIFDEDFTAEMPPALIRGLLPRNGLVIDGGISGVGKTFIEVDMAVALASGGDWFGQPVRERVGVVYIAAEGQSSIQRRFIAAKRHRGIEDEKLPIAVPAWSSIDLRDPKKRIEVIGKLKAISAQMQERFGVRLGCIILDTISAACSMKDENSSAEAAAVCRELREIIDATDTTLVAVHHFGKTQESGLRGSSAWRANCDHSRVFLGNRDGPDSPMRDRKMALEKNRLGPEGEAFEFELAVLDFGRNSYGDPMSECAVDIKGKISRKPKMTKLEKEFTRFFHAALSDYKHTEAMGLRPDLRAVPIDAVREKFKATVASGQERLTREQSEALRSAWNRAFKIAQEKLFTAETISGVEWVWPNSGLHI
jgi:hypothetical protein